MVRDVIEGIKETEAEAEAIVEKARTKKAELIAKAREEARDLVEQARKQGAERMKQALEKAREDADRKSGEIANEEARMGEDVRRSSSKNVPRAVEVVIERMLE